LIYFKERPGLLPTPSESLDLNYLNLIRQPSLNYILIQQISKKFIPKIHTLLPKTILFGEPYPNVPAIALNLDVRHGFVAWCQSCFNVPFPERQWLKFEDRILFFQVHIPDTSLHLS
jgi:hypothetical protein